MSERTFRITVRGAFDGLRDEQRAALVAEAAEHDVLQAAFTAEGHLTYDVAARPFFTFRFLDSGEAEEDIVPGGRPRPGPGGLRARLAGDRARERRRGDRPTHPL
ncbi:DUF6204 family protein, partial [Embleya sp. NPDC005575]|uniref:DUF6204 family protein n=1 Tax=Embleya sp. NPDC005575 TaxID=3156892 RepID=UPI0033A26322